MSHSITIVSVVKDDHEGLLATLASIFEQITPVDEVIVVDGLSRDGSLELAQSFSDCGVRVVKGPDNGIYDAMNKGLQAASSDYVWFLNAGDTLADSSTLRSLATYLVQSPSDWLYGAAVPVDTKRKQVGPVLQGSCTTKNLRKGLVHFNHQAMIMSRRMLQSLGGFRLKYPLAAEYDLYLRASSVAEAQPIPQILVNFRVGGTSHRHRVQHMREMGEARREYFEMRGLKALQDSLRTNYLAWRTSSALNQIPVARRIRNWYLEHRYGSPPVT